MNNTKQIEFINHDVCDMSLKGIPGGGKTKSIIDKMICLNEIGYIMKNDNFLILTFTRNAKNDFKQKGKLKNKKLFTDNNVKTIHSLSKTILNNLMDKSSSNISTIVASLLYNLTRDESLDISCVSCLKNCKVIFVDEAQDISDVQYKTIQIISKKINCNVIMVGDPNQNIYQFQGGSDKYLIEHSKNSIQLIYNYRSTKSIVEFLNHFRPWKNESEPMISKREEIGDKPIVYCGHLNYLIHKLHKELNKTDIPFEEIAIIGPVKKGNYNKAGYNLNIGLQIFAEYFEDNNIPYISHYILSSSDANKKIKDKKEGHINLYTIHGSKGLEFRKVFLLNFHYATMGRVPNMKMYNEYKYLWFTGLSRAKDELSILIDRGKTAWLELGDCPRNLYHIKYDDKEYGQSGVFYNVIKKSVISEEDDNIESISVTDMLENRLFTEDKQHTLERMVYADIISVKLFDAATNEIEGISEYAALYGVYMENIFSYFYLKSHSSDKLKYYVKKFLMKNNHMIVIPNHLHTCFLKLNKKFGEITLKILRENILDLDEDGRNIIKYLERIHNLQEEQPISLKKNNGVSSFDQEYFMKYWTNLEENKYVPESLFYICLYFYQIEHECMSLLSKDFKDHLLSLKPYILKIIKYARECKGDYEFQVRNDHPNLPIYGYADIKCGDKIIDIKFTKEFKQSYVYQLLLYYNNIYPKWNKKPQLEVINLFTGVKTIINIKDTLNNRDLNYFLCETFNIKMKNNIIVYDLETTGLDTRICEIIERYMYDMTLNSVFSEGLVKSRQFIGKYITNLTGITNKLVNESGEPLPQFKEEMIDKLKYYDTPTFIAHNGNKFDHIILRREGILSDDNCNFLDSMNIINTHIKEKIYGMNLKKIYEKLVGNENINAHRAAEDTYMILTIFNKLNITCEHIHKIVKLIKMSNI